MKLPLVVVAGPTAAGKSALALQLAQLTGAEILVADSRQVYVGMDVGTAKPTAEQRGGITYHGLDLVEPGAQFSVADYRAHAQRAIAAAHARGVGVVLEGGTGLYVRALLHGLMDLPPRDPAFREQLAATAQTMGWPALHAQLAQVDPEHAQRVKPTDPVRITRALEVHHLTGIPMGQHEKRHAFADAPYDVTGVLLDLARPQHRTAVEQRVARMWTGGLMDETRSLLALLGPDHPLLQTINYAQAAEFLAGRMDMRAAQADMVLRTVQFAKRQRTWFRKEACVAPVADLQAWMQVAQRVLKRV